MSSGNLNLPSPGVKFRRAPFSASSTLNRTSGSCHTETKRGNTKTLQARALKCMPSAGLRHIPIQVWYFDNRIVPTMVSSTRAFSKSQVRTLRGNLATTLFRKVRRKSVFLSGSGSVGRKGNETALGKCNRTLLISPSCL